LSSSSASQVSLVFDHGGEKLTQGTGAGFPVAGKKLRWMRISPGILFFCKHFGTGVLVATAFVHVQPAVSMAVRKLTTLVADPHGILLPDRSVPTTTPDRAISCNAWSHHDGRSLRIVHD
jgi:hypothetical protein